MDNFTVLLLQQAINWRNTRSVKLKMIVSGPDTPPTSGQNVPGSIQSINQSNDKWQHFFLFIWSVCPHFYLEQAFTIELIRSRNPSRISTKLSAWGSPNNGDSGGPTFNTYNYKELCNLRRLYTRMIHQLKRLGIWLGILHIIDTFFLWWKKHWFC